MDLVSADEIAALRNSGTFDEEWYVEQYPDVKMLGMDPVEHYLWLGSKIGRKPSRAVRDERGEIFAAMDPSLEDRIKLLAESTLLDAAYVCKQVGRPICSNLEVARLYYETAELRQLKPNPLFDPSYYRHVNDLHRSVDAVWHYLRIGAARHLPFHRLFDVEWYMSQVPEAKSSLDLLDHYWKVAYPQGILPIDEHATSIHAEIKRMFLTNKSGEYNEFDLSIYREFNSDISGYSDDQLREHYVKFGKSEGRFGSIGDICSVCNVEPRFVPMDFTPQAYAEIHFDLAESLRDGFWTYLLHYLANGITEGRAYNIDDLFGYALKSDRVFSTGGLDSLTDKKALCVLMHLYYPDMWQCLQEYIANIDDPFDLYVNLVDTTWTPGVISQIRAEYPNARIYISENRGRDVGGYFRLMDSINFDRYVAFATLHSKKSPHVTRSHAENWRSNLIGALLGSSELIKQNLAAFVEDESVGIIGAAKHREEDIGNNVDAYSKLLDVYGIDAENRDCEYVSGTMMMIRSELMKEVYLPLREHKFESGDNKGMDFYIDGQLEHAVERIFGNVAKQSGYCFLWR